MICFSHFYKTNITIFIYLYYWIEAMWQTFCITHPGNLFPLDYVNLYHVLTRIGKLYWQTYKYIGKENYTPNRYRKIPLWKPRVEARRWLAESFACFVLPSVKGEWSWVRQSASASPSGWETKWRQGESLFTPVDWPLASQSPVSRKLTIIDFPSDEKEGRNSRCSDSEYSRRQWTLLT